MFTNASASLVRRSLIQVDNFCRREAGWVVSIVM
jgi:hypothetical protein